MYKCKYAHIIILKQVYHLTFNTSLEAKKISTFSRNSLLPLSSAPVDVSVAVLITY